jgi:branched-chain amino acid transport system ATP-binding protein
MSLLEVDDITVRYGKVTALKGVSVQVDRGEIVSLIGANGAGKTSTMRALAGLVPLASGSVRLDGHDLSATSGHDRVRRGLCLAPEGRGIFPTMTVAENLEMGAYGRKDKRAIAEDRDRVFDLFPRVRERAGQLGGTLSGGEQQMLAIGRALMARPQVLLLDEPSMGLAPGLIKQVFAIIRDLTGLGVTILLVEQNARQAMALADRVYILETGEVTRIGTGHELLADPAVQRAYLGVA